MREVKLNRENVLTRLRDNREKHAAIYAEAKDGYRAEVIRALTEALESASNGGKIITDIPDNSPVSMLGEYDTVIDMLEMAVDEEITLSQQEFKQYMRDEWPWKTTFLFSNAAYSSTAAAAAPQF